ncbi:hypothetical protein DFH09DRAFT_1287252 [Mycena vulgaris]|nr:hypothetical protein DFH09DRAFT_1287252 [Mycena vulgaris]
MNRTPFAIQELVDGCIDLIADSPSDLAACAAVSRSWVYTAQKHIFKDVAIGSSDVRKNERLWSLLQDALYTSPHLVRNIRRLCITANPFSEISFDTFSAICNFPFTHLEHIIIDNTSNFTLRLALALQQLVSLPNIRHLGITLRVTELAPFLHIWDRCSPSIRHLDLRCHPEPTEPSLFIPHHRSTATMLESLRIAPLPGICDWLAHEHCPFDLSRLKSVMIYPGGSQTTFLLQNLARACRTIETLGFTTIRNGTKIDLSLFPTLTVLIIAKPFAGPPTMAVESLSTVSPSNRIRRIVIRSSCLDAKDCQELESKLSDLPMRLQPTVEIEMETIWGFLTTANLKEYFPRLSAKNLVHQVPRDDTWS